MIGILFRFISGVVMGVPIAILAYYVLPLMFADIEFHYIILTGLTAGAIGTLTPSLLLKGIACGLMWKSI